MAMNTMLRALMLFIFQVKKTFVWFNEFGGTLLEGLYVQHQIAPLKFHTCVWNFIYGRICFMGWGGGVLVVLLLDSLGNLT